MSFADLNVISRQCNTFLTEQKQSWELVQWFEWIIFKEPVQKRIQRFFRRHVVPDIPAMRTRMKTLQTKKKWTGK